MMREHFGFTILGSQTPVTGFKLETAKPTITIKGNIVSSKHKAFIMNLELTAGVQENVMQLFSGSELNSFFKFNLGGNFIIDKANSARFLKEDTIIRRLTKKKVCQYREEIEKTMDTFLVLKAFIQHSYTTSSINQIVSWITLQAQSAAYNLGGYTRSYLPSSSAQVYYDSMVVRMMNKYASAPFTYTHSDSSVNTFLTQLLNPTSTLIKVSTLLEDYTRLLKFEDPEDEVREEIWKDYQIETYRNVWAKKIISWVNISLMGSNSSFKMFNSTDSTLMDSKSFLPGISLSFNYLSKYKEATRFFYLKAALDFQRSIAFEICPSLIIKRKRS